MALINVTVNSSYNGNDNNVIKNNLIYDELVSDDANSEGDYLIEYKKLTMTIQKVIFPKLQQQLLPKLSPKMGTMLLFILLSMTVI